MPKRLPLLLIFFATIAYAQPPASIDELGKAITDAIVANDSLQFYSLALPVDGMLEVFNSFSSELTKEELKTGEENMRINYPKTIAPTYGITFFILANKVGIFNLSFENVVFEEIETDETKEIDKLVGVHGRLEHEKFRHITFLAYPYNNAWYLFNHQVDISETNAFDRRKALRAIELSKDNEGYLQVEASFSLEEVEATKAEVLSCMDKFPVSAGKEDLNYGSDDDPEFYMNGTWSYYYYVNSDDDPAGDIAYDYHYVIKDDAIYFRYTNFVHSQEESEFSSIGRLPLEANDKVLNTFTEAQYEEILRDILLEARRGIKSRKYLIEYCLKN